jgi:uncharacterized repeat protein (TIGR01451 family)
MKTLFLLLVLMAALIVPSQSQMSSIVSDAKMSAVDENKPKGPHIFEREATSPICINQTFDSSTKNIIYYIFVKNTGETKLTDVVVEDTLPEGVVYGRSYYFDPVDKNLTIKDVVSRRDGTTKILRWHLGDLQTGEEKKILVTVDRGDLNDRADDQKNAVSVKAVALNPSEKVAFETAAEEISGISVTDIVIEENAGENLTCRITVENTDKTRLKDVVLKDTLPADMEYVGSRYTESVGEEILPEPTIINNLDGTTESVSWFLGDFDSGRRKSIDLIVSCSSGDCSNWEAHNQVEASGWTSIVNKIPIKVTSGEYQETEDTIVEAEEPVTAPEENDSISMPGEIIA